MTNKVVAAKEAQRRAVVYCRVSTEEQAKGGVSIDMQTERLHHLAKVHDLQVLEVIKDAGLSGKNLSRPGVERIIELSRRKAITHVLVYKLDRLSRSIKDISFIMELFAEKGVSLMSATESLDTASPMGRMVCNILGSFAQFERELIAERTRDSLEQLWKAGRWTTTTPFGYQRDEHKNIVPDPKTAPLVIELFQKVYERRLTMGDALAYVRSDPRFTETRKWTKAGVWQTLKSRVYLGEIRRGDLWKAGIHLPIIAREVFDGVQDMLNGRYNVGKALTSVTPNLLSGIAICGTCGRRLVLRTGRRKGAPSKPIDPTSPRYTYYQCPSYLDTKDCSLPIVPSPVLEDAVFNRMAAVGQDRPLLEELVSNANRILENNTKSERYKVAAFQKRITELDKKIKRMVDYISDAPGDDRELRGELTERLGALTAEKKALSDKMCEVQARMDLKMKDRLDVDLLVSVLMVPRLYLPMMSRKELRAVMKGLITKATVWDRDRIEIEVSIPADIAPERPLAPRGDGVFAWRIEELPGLDAMRTTLPVGRLWLTTWDTKVEFRLAA